MNWEIIRQEANFTGDHLWTIMLKSNKLLVGMEALLIRSWSKQLTAMNKSIARFLEEKEETHIIGKFLMDNSFPKLFTKQGVCLIVLSLLLTKALNLQGSEEMVEGGLMNTSCQKWQNCWHLWTRRSPNPRFRILLPNKSSNIWIWKYRWGSILLEGNWTSSLN